jgi:DNA mismatch repair protein MutL
MHIHILPDEVASQIAAGEVIERPASVVKELVENALDAGAMAVHIRVQGAGRRLVEVTDDGAGIPAAELPLAALRHATSKLEKADDLFKVTSLGFRGEALASIGSVARLTITSRPPGEQAGARLRVEGGRAGAVEPVGAPHGTQVQVEDLFYNVPARLKFLKSEVTERRLIDELVTRYALAFPQVRFRLDQEGRPALQTSGNGERREILALLYGVETARQMLALQAQEDELSASGFISPASLTRSNRREVHFFVNRRPVQDIALTTAFIQAYHTLLMVGRYPFGMVFLELPPEAVDVNVHPTKAEVRFRERERVFSAVQRAVRRALLAYTPVPGIQPPLAWKPASAWEAPPRRSDPGWEMAGEAGGADLQGAAPPAEAAPPVGGPPAPLVGGVPLLRPVGQIALAYLIAEGPDGLYLIDQHAAHERVLFERMTGQAGESAASQSLLEPVSVELPPAASRLLESQLASLDRLGFRVEEFGRNTFLVRAVPALLTGMDPAAALRVLVEDFEEDESPLQGQAEARIIARVCKRAAVKAGQTLSAEEQKALLADLEACRSPRTCPHGRPTMIHLSVDLLERQFGRRGPR